MLPRIAEILHRAKLIDDLQLRSAMAHQTQWGGRLSHIVVEKRFAREEAVIDAIANAMKLPKVDLDTMENDPAAQAKVDLDFARTRGVFPFALKDAGKTLWLAMSDPSDVPVVDELAMKVRGVRIKIVVASERQIQAAIKRCYLGDSSSQAPAFGSIQPAELSATTDAEEEEGKIVDMSGRTLVKNIKDIRPPEPKAAPPPVAPPSAASALLDDLIGSGAPAAVLTPAEMERLRSIQDQQEKGARILRAVLELCIERRVFGMEEYRSRLK